MLLAIDVGNTQSVYGLWDGTVWRQVWRRSTGAADTEDEIAGWLRTMFDMAGHPFQVERAVCASVVPQLNRSLGDLVSERFGRELLMLDSSTAHGLTIGYSPASAIGADRIANCVGALKKWSAPIVVVDFGTATTFDVVDSSATYVGGAILPGIEVSTEALVSRTAKLPRFELSPPERAIGRSTVEALQSGVMLGYAGAIDAIVGRIAAELEAKPKVVSTGGLGGMFVGLAGSISEYDPNLTLDGLRYAFEAKA